MVAGRASSRKAERTHTVRDLGLGSCIQALLNTLLNLGGRCLQDTIFVGGLRKSTTEETWVVL